MAGVLVVGLGATGLVAVLVPREAVGSSAAERARALGEPVVDLAQVDEFTTVWANPDGTQTFEFFVSPVRAWGEDGWQDVDPSLVAREVTVGGGAGQAGQAGEQAGEGLAERRLVPRASAVEVSFATGGAATAAAARAGSGAAGGAGSDVSVLVRLSVQDTTLALRWDGALPEAEVEGARAVYRQARPGLDLVVEATDVGFAQYLVVRDRAAAERLVADPVALGVEVDGGSLALGEGGGLVLTDEAGQVVGEGPAAAMWDSAAAASTGTGAGREVGTGAAARTGDGQASDLEALLRPDDADRQGPVGLSLDEAGRSGAASEKAAQITGRGTLRLAPDEELLVGGDAVYPVVVDPTVGLTQRRRAMVNAYYPSTSYHQWSGDQGAGYINYNGQRARKRLFWQFDTDGKIAGRQVLAATYRVVQTHQFDCTVSTTQLWSVGSLPSTVTWNSQPAFGERLADLRGAYTRSGCSPGYRTWEVSVRDKVQEGADKSWSRVTFGLRAADEGSNTGWKRFRNDASLSVTVNRAPDVPSGLGFATPEAPCSVPGGQWHNVPKLDASFVTRDPDRDNAKGIIEVYAGPDRSRYVKTVTTPLRGDGHRHTANIIVSALHGEHYWWRVQTEDAHGARSGWSGWCSLVVDQVPPGAPAVSSADFGGPVDAVVHTTGTVRLSPAAGDGDVVAYRWGELEATRRVAAPSGSVEVSFTPTRSGPHRLVAVAIDRAGNESPAGELAFVVNLDRPSGAIDFNEGTGQFAGTDSAGSQAVAELEHTDPASVWVAGASGGVELDDHAVRLDGVDDAVVVPAAGLLDTSAGFSVGAHLEPSAPPGRASVVSVDAAAPDSGSAGGAGGAGFVLGWSESGELEFRVSSTTAAGPLADWADPAWTVVSAPVPAHLADEDWLGVAGVYDADADGGTPSIVLYLDGTEAARTPVTAGSEPARALGYLRVGRTGGACATSTAPGSVACDHYAGVVDNVRLYTFAAGASQVRSWTSVATDPDAFLRPGEQLVPGEAAASPSGDVWLALATDGALALHQRGADGATSVLWTATGTPGSGADRAVLQGDGNLVAYAGTTVVWQSGTTSSPGSLLRVGNDGAARIHDADNLIVWSTAGGTP